MEIIMKHKRWRYRSPRTQQKITLELENCENYVDDLEIKFTHYKPSGGHIETTITINNMGTFEIGEKELVQGVSNGSK